MKSTVLRLVSYLNFNGNCEEALNIYAGIFGGKVTVHQRYDNPAMNAPAEFHNKVLHASLEFGPVTILASDIVPRSPRETGAGTGDAALSLDVSDPETGRRIFAGLAEGGSVGVPFAKQFWGAWHGNLRDRFGIRWMVNCEAGE